MAAVDVTASRLQQNSTAETMRTNSLVDRTADEVNGEDGDIVIRVEGKEIEKNKDLESSGHMDSPVQTRIRHRKTGSNVSSSSAVVGGQGVCCQKEFCEDVGMMLLWISCASVFRNSVHVEQHTVTNFIL